MTHPLFKAQLKDKCVRDLVRWKTTAFQEKCINVIYEYSVKMWMWRFIFACVFVCFYDFWLFFFVHAIFQHYFWVFMFLHALHTFLFFHMHFFHINNFYILFYHFPTDMARGVNFICNAISLTWGHIFIWWSQMCNFRMQYDEMQLRLFFHTWYSMSLT